eukprot:CAMPEP_0206477218 /NCGR_PEP_ID=MMETSP0324_2-20121206/35219_1 /ASSEMBLY_ACC=CAM_ASM_000836 /TAXON_ID=2866 /ORGANISM="Crypthecodinium cohnii, Strain Seligo" /LENGTH=69 /DNA_ID=CAMNT_0053953075 /DNA_START=53 /DNA_END=262 /DNA_ORIENTATION=+
MYDNWGFRSSNMKGDGSATLMARQAGRRMSRQSRAAKCVGGVAALNRAACKRVPTEKHAFMSRDQREDM